MYDAFEDKIIEQYVRIKPQLQKIEEWDSRAYVTNEPPEQIHTLRYTENLGSGPIYEVEDDENLRKRQRTQFMLEPKLMKRHVKLANFIIKKLKSVLAETTLVSRETQTVNEQQHSEMQTETGSIKVRSVASQTAWSINNTSGTIPVANQSTTSCSSEIQNVGNVSN